MAVATRSARRARSPRPGSAWCPRRAGGPLRRRPGLYRVGAADHGAETRPLSYRAAFRPGVPWPGRSCGRRTRKKARPQRARRAWPCLFFWAAQAAQTLAPQGLAGASARPRRPGGRTAARAGAGRRHRTRHRPCAAGLPGVWMAARHRCRARHRIVTGGCLARYLRPLGPHRAGWGLGPGAEGWGPQIGHASGFRINEKSGTPWGSALFQKGGRFRAVLRHVSTLPRFSRPVKRQSLPSCALPP